MDCCNYMQYRHHQPYYGSQYYDPLPPAAAYHGDFYGHHQMYQEYYGNSHYYPQQWPCAASFPDYVYNPKEARIRKAMRDATRERSIGASPMLPRPSARRAPHSWVSPHEELMMSPLAGMRSTMDPSPVCGFPLSSAAAGSNQFMSAAMNGTGYNKLEPPPMPSTSSSVHSNYMQSNPLAQLQQHTDMWHDYQTMRPRSSGNPFMLPEVSPYHSQTPELPLMQMEKQAQMAGPGGSGANPGTSPHHPNENTPPEESTIVTEKIHQADAAEFESKSMMEGAPQAMDSGQDHFMPVFEQNDADRRLGAFDKLDDVKMKKPAVPQIRNSTKRPSSKPLPDFNEAFGSTERGRFQSPPDPRLAPNKGYLDYFFDSSPIKYDDYQI